MNEREAAIDTYFLAHQEVLAAIYEYTDSLVKTARADRLTSFDFVQDDDTPQMAGEAEEKIEHAAKTAGDLEHFMRNRRQSEKVEQLYRSNPLYTPDDIAAMMHHFEIIQPEMVSYRSAKYPNELILTSIALYDKTEKAYARRVIIQKMDDLVCETYTLTFVDDLPVSIHKEMAAVGEKSQEIAKDTDDFLATINFDDRPAALELRQLARYLKDFPPLWEY